MQDNKKEDNKMQDNKMQDNKIRTVLKSSGKLAMIRKNPDSFETVRKIGNDSEKSGHFWNRPENWQSSGKIRTVLKPSGKLAMIRKNLDSFETVRKMGYDPEKSGKLAMIRKNPDIFETVRKIDNHLEKSGQFWNRPENWLWSGKIRIVLEVLWPPCKPSQLFWSKMASAGVPHIVLHVLCSTRTFGGQFRPSEVRFRAIFAVSSNLFYKTKTHFLQKGPFPPTTENLCVDSQTPPGP